LEPAFLFAALFPSALSADTSTHHFNSLATATPTGAINIALVLSGGLLNGVATHATLIFLSEGQQWGRHDQCRHRENRRRHCSRKSA